MLYCLWLIKKTLVLSVLLNIMVDKCSLLSCLVVVVVVVVIRSSSGYGITLAQAHRGEIATSRHGV